MAVELGGLPAGTVASVSVTGPNGYIHIVSASEQVNALNEGTYTLAASDVTVGGVRYAATPAAQNVIVIGHAVVSANTIKYAAATGRLSVTVSGLAAPATATIAVAGPNGFATTVATTTTLDVLAPGTYTITSSDVQAGGKTYHPDPTTQTVTVSASPTPSRADVSYGAGTATLNLSIAGLPAGTDAAVTVVGGGLSRLVTTSTTLHNLEAGSYAIAAATVASSLTTHTPTVAAQSVSVTTGGAVPATVTYGSAPLQLALQPVIAGLVNASFVTSIDGDARLFIVERAGRVRIFENGALLGTPFFDISDHVNSLGERGMLSIAFDPDFATNGYVYAYYVATNGDMVVERLTSTPGSNTASPTGSIVFSTTHGGKDHHGGLIAFGPDGMLYVAPGDGGCCGDPNNNAQNVTSFLGKILRLNVRTLPYTIPAGNPFASTEGRLREIWAYGLRNPWRFAFDAPSGLLFIGDVGQDSREEVDVVSATGGGYNFGWRVMEATACYIPSSGCNTTGLTMPALDYPHSDGCSVTGGYVYRGAAIPELTGHYLYADYCNGWLRSFRAAPGNPIERQTWSVTAPGTLSFGRDGAGELYMLAADKLSRIVRQ